VPGVDGEEPMKKVTYLISALCLTACESGGGTSIDMGPVGDGLNFLGFSIVLGVLLALIGAFIMKGNGK